MPSGRFDEKGWAMMIDVSSKAPTFRSAIASALVRMAPDTLAHVLEGRTAKGDVFAVARLAGITAAKKTPDLIPLAHSIAVHSVSIDFSHRSGRRHDPDREHGARIRAHRGGDGGDDRRVGRRP